MRTWKEVYGDDIDGNRGIIVDMYELEHTDEEISAIVEILYEDFLQGDTKRTKEIELDGINIEVDIEDYKDKILEKIVNDINLEYEEVEFIAEELNDTQILNEWCSMKKCLHKEKGN